MAYETLEAAVARIAELETENNSLRGSLTFEAANSQELLQRAITAEKVVQECMAGASVYEEQIQRLRRIANAYVEENTQEGASLALRFLANGDESLEERLRQVEFLYLDVQKNAILPRWETLKAELQIETA